MKLKREDNPSNYSTIKFFSIVFFIGVESLCLSSSVEFLPPGAAELVVVCRRRVGREPASE